MASGVAGASSGGSLPGLSEAIAAFAAVQQTCRKTGANGLNTPEVKQKLDRIIQIAPNHLSAKYLRQAADRKQPTKLSLSMSLYRAFVAIAPLKGALWDGQDPSRESFPEKTAFEVRQRLRAHLSDRVEDGVEGDETVRGFRLLLVLDRSS